MKGWPNVGKLSPAFAMTVPLRKTQPAQKQKKQNPQETQSFSRVLVRPERFELPAFWSVARRSIQLS